MEEKNKKEEVPTKATLRKELQDQSRGYVLVGLGLVAGLAWNDAIKALIESVFPFSKDGVWIKFIYALLVTLVVIILGHYIFKSK